MTDFSADKLRALDNDDDWGCEHCRNDGRLENGRCPKCDAEYPDEDEQEEPKA